MTLNILPRLLIHPVSIDDVDDNARLIRRLVVIGLLPRIDRHVTKHMARSVILILSQLLGKNLLQTERHPGADDEASLRRELLVRQRVDEWLVVVADELLAIAADEFGVVLAVVSLLVGVRGQHGEVGALLRRPGARVALPPALEEAEVQRVVDRGRVVGLQAALLEVPARLLGAGQVALRDVDGRVECPDVFARGVLFQVDGEADFVLLGAFGDGEELEVAVVLGRVVQDAFVVPVAVDFVGFGEVAGWGWVVVLGGFFRLRSLVSGLGLV